MGYFFFFFNVMKGKCVDWWPGYNDSMVERQVFEVMGIVQLYYMDDGQSTEKCDELYADFDTNNIFTLFYMSLRVMENSEFNRLISSVA